MDDLSIRVNRTLAADVSQASIELKNDQVWEFSGSGGEPPALSVQTSYGLRCQGIKLFPRFTLQDTTLTDPRTFDRPGSIKKRFTNYLFLQCTPFSSIDVELEYWVPSSTSICGRTRIVNNGKSLLILGCEWAVLLHPHETGVGMSSAEMGINTVLRGATEDLFPVFFLTGGPQSSSGSYPALGLEMTLAAGAERRVSWSLASLETYEASFTLARQNTALLWDANLLKQEMAEKRQSIYFMSDHPVIDDLLHEAQVKAQQALIQRPAPVKRLTLLDKRQPDSPLGAYAYSARLHMGNLPANGYDLWQASRLLLPAKPEVVKELIQSFIDAQLPDGSIPWAVNANGTATKALAVPLLAGIARDAYIYQPDPTWLGQVYAPLLDSFKAWFDEERLAESHEKPAWTNLLQTGLDSAPLYSIWQTGDQGLDLRFVDSPALAAMLYHESQALLQLSQFLNETDGDAWLQTTASELRDRVLDSWNEQKGTFVYRDIQTSQCLSAALLFETKTNGTTRVNLDCGQERRLIVRCRKGDSLSGIIEVALNGKNSQGEVNETFHFGLGQFQEGMARLTSHKLFAAIEKVEINGLRETDQVILTLAGYDEEDISLLLPLWAGIPTAEQAKTLVEKTILPRYAARNGLASLPLDRYPDRVPGVKMLWSELIIEGLVNYGFRHSAADLLLHQFEGVTQQWRASGFLNETIAADKPKGLGTRDTLSSLPGLLPFLRVLGIERFSTNDILFNGLNEYLPAFTVQYGRTNVQMKADGTTISTLNGSKIEFHEPGMYKGILP
jgi:hypothetical protein